MNLPIPPVEGREKAAMKDLDFVSSLPPPPCALHFTHRFTHAPALSVSSRCLLYLCVRDPQIVDTK
jgi:hypothetical protein